VRLPRPGPGIGHDLTVQQELACALRILAREGWRENLSGHITVATDDGGMLCNPWGIWWEEARASDILQLDADGAIVAGPWDVTPAVFLHTELHRARADAAASKTPTTASGSRLTSATRAASSWPITARS
jgi:ribulose-5-phosphate 4-epimerase/fuculose-1-phosphate aldolase